MVVGIGKILKFNRKCTIVVGLLFAVIFLALVIVPGQADADGFIDEASGQTTTDEMYPEDTIEAYADTLTNVLPTAGVAQTDIITVCSSGCDYTSIQEAIDNANDGDTIEVHSGTYYENVRVNKELTIISESGNPDDTIVQAADPGDEVFYVISDNVTINGFKVTGATYSLTFAIDLHNVRNCSILNNKILDNWLGIWFYGSSYNAIANNIISNSGWGIYVGHSSNNNKLNNNSIISNQNGIYLEDTNNHTLNDNNFINNDLGINLDNSNNNNIFGNNFGYNTIYGIYLQGSNGNHIYANNFINNNNNANSSYSINNWNSTEQITYQYNGSTFINYVGNYWSDYTGLDSDSDGIGDTPYEINDSAELQDNYPLIEPWEGVDLALPYVTITFPANLATIVKINTDITATFSEPMDSSTLNNSTVKVYTLDEIVGETFEDTNGSWNSGNFQGFNHSEELTVWQTPIDDTNRTIEEGNLTYTTHSILRDYHVYSNEDIEVEDSGNYSVIGWLGDENVVINSGAGDWIISKLVFEQNSTDTKTLHVGETWDLGDGYSIKLINLDKDGKDAWIALNNSSGKIDDEFSQNQSACIFSTDLGASDNTPIFVTYLNKVNLAQSHIDLKYTWLISQETSEIQNNEQLGDFKVKTLTDRIIIENDEDMFLMRDSTIPLFYDFKFEIEDTSTVQYSLIYQYHTDTSVDGDISYDNASRTITFDPVSNLKYDTNYISYITTGAEDLAGNGLMEDYKWEFKTMHYTPSGNGGSSGGGGGGGGFVSNLILNPGFEYLTQGQPDNWTLSGTASVTDTLSSEGNNSLNINASISGDILFANQTLDIYHVAGKSYTFTFDIARSGGISGDAISFYLNYIDFNATKQSLYVWTPNPDGDNNFWIYYHEQIIPSDAFNITGFEMHTNGTGEYWIDNLSIEIEQTPPFLDLYQNYTIEVLEIDIDGSEIWLEINKNGNPVKDIVIQNLSTYEYRNVTTNDLIINCTVSYVQFLNDNRSWVVLLEDIWQFSDVDGSVLINGTYNTFFGGEQYHDASMLPSGSAVLDIYESTGDVFSFDIGEVENDFIIVEGDGALKFDQTLNISGNLVDMGVVTIDTVTAAPDEGYVNGSVLPVLGHTYCVNISGKYAKFEVVDVTTKNIRIRWSYQPDGTKNFIHTALSLPETDDGDTSSSGGGGSGGGGSSGEDYYNIVLSETDRQSVFKNSHISYRFDLEDNIVSHINFRALKSAGTIAAKVEILNNTSTLVSTLPPHEVFRNLNIWVGNAGWGTKRNIADATVVFTVDKSWITKNNIDESSIALYRYSDDTWHKLVTKKIAEDANNLQFEAETPGFSPFAVTGKTIGEPGGEGIIEPTVTAEKTTAPTPTEEKGIPGFGLFAGLSVLLIAVQLLRKKE